MNENDVQNTDIQDTIPEYSEDTQNIDGNGDETVTPDGELPVAEDVTRDTDTPSAQSSVSEQNDVSEPFISVQYNHKNRDFTKEEAIKFIQKGMHTEQLRAKLEYLAKSQGVDVNSFVEKIISAPENAYRTYLEQMYGKGSEDVEIGMKIYREKQSDEYKKIMADRENSILRDEKNKSVNTRMASEYLILKEQMPDAPDYSELPDSVIIEAAEGKRDLYSAYLCYLHKEKLKIDAAKKIQTAANAASSGSMGKNDENVISSSDRNFLSGLWSK